MSKKNIYVVETYGYSGFETFILCHDDEMSNEKFFKIVKKAQRLCKKNKYHNSYFNDYALNMIECLIKVYGFERFEYPCVHIGSSVKSKLRGFLNE